LGLLAAESKHMPSLNNSEREFLQSASQPDASVIDARQRLQ
jgi:hypothetical protein